MTVLLSTCLLYLAKQPIILQWQITMPVLVIYFLKTTWGASKHPKQCQLWERNKCEMNSYACEYPVGEHWKEWTTKQLWARCVLIVCLHGSMMKCLAVKKQSVCTVQWWSDFLLEMIASPGRLLTAANVFLIKTPNQCLQNDRLSSKWPAVYKITNCLQNDQLSTKWPVCSGMSCHQLHSHGGVLMYRHQPDLICSAQIKKCLYLWHTETNHLIINTFRTNVW